MIIDVIEKENAIHMYIDVNRKKELDELLQYVIYAPSLQKWELLQKKILRLPSCKQWRGKLKEEYFISTAKEYNHYYIDVYDEHIYRIVWKKIRVNPIQLPIGTSIYHLTHPKNVDTILREGLNPSKYSTDNVYYGSNRIYFLTEPLMDENEDYLDAHLYNRIQIEIEYDGTFLLYEDPEYGHHKKHPMAYAITDDTISVKGISPIQPKKKYGNKKII